MTMHELSLARSIHTIVADHAGPRRVKRVRVAIGPLACVEPQALTFCWDLVTQGSGLAGAELEFVDAEDDVLVVRDYVLEEAA